jgi:hypothetical protein
MPAHVITTTQKQLTILTSDPRLEHDRVVDWV